MYAMLYWTYGILFALRDVAYERFSKDIVDALFIRFFALRDVEGAIKLTRL